MAEKRLTKELQDLRILINQDDSIRNLTVDENNLYKWKLTIFVADEEQYDFQINFPSI
jgi:ubiquitin-protein ligase